MKRKKKVSLNLQIHVHMLSGLTRYHKCRVSAVALSPMFKSFLIGDNQLCWTDTKANANYI